MLSWTAQTRTARHIRKMPRKLTLTTRSKSSGSTLSVVTLVLPVMPEVRGVSSKSVSQLAEGERGCGDQQPGQGCPLGPSAQ